METRLNYQQKQQLSLPSIPTDTIKEVMLNVGVASNKPLFGEVALPQPRVTTVPYIETLLPVATSFLSALKYSLYAVLFILWFVDSMAFSNYEGGLIGFVADCLSGFQY